jgi:hypothetical protein
MVPLLVVLLGSADARSQSMEGWQRVPDAQLKFEADYAACTQASKPAPGLGLPPGLPTGGISGNGYKPPPPQLNVQCMRARGWVKPDEAPKARAAQ